MWPLSELIHLQELLRALHKAPSEWRDKLVACHCHPERTASVPHRAEGKMGLSKAPESSNLLSEGHCSKYLESCPEYPLTAPKPAYQSFSLLHFTLHQCIKQQLYTRYIHKLYASYKLYTTPQAARAVCRHVYLHLVKGMLY